MKRILILFSLLIFLFVVGSSTGNLKLDFGNLKKYFPQPSSTTNTARENVKVISEESVITDAVDKV